MIYFNFLFKYNKQNICINDLNNDCYVIKIL